MEQRIAADGVAPRPEHEAPRSVTTAAERRAYGWVHLVVSLLCCALPIWVLLLFVRDWDRVTQSNTPIWVGLVMLACYAAPALAFLGIGHFLLTGRIRLLKFGGAYSLTAVVIGITLFAVFD
ncbi:MAG: hypothetical protein ABGY72_18175 [bacterium]